MNDMTLQKMYKIFGLRKISKIQELEDWLVNLPELDEKEKIVINVYQERLLESIEGWNKHELSLGFIGPILNLVDFKVPYKINLFAQRPIFETIGDYELYGKPDGLIASGFIEPEVPYFSFHVPIAIGNKKDVNSSGDPIGQNLAAMLVGQALNENKEPIYGSYVVGRLWYFMVLKEKEFAISKAYSADDEEILEIVKILKALRDILFKRINYTRDKK